MAMHKCTQRVQRIRQMDSTLMHCNTCWLLTNTHAVHLCTMGIEYQNGTTFMKRMKMKSYFSLNTDKEKRACERDSVNVIRFFSRIPSSLSIVQVVVPHCICVLVCFFFVVPLFLSVHWLSLSCLRRFGFIIKIHKFNVYMHTAALAYFYSCDCCVFYWIIFLFLFFFIF